MRHALVLPLPRQGPERARPTSQYAIESRLPWFHELAELPGTRLADDPPPDADALESYQDASGRR